METNGTEAIEKLRERLRLAKDHMARSQKEFEGALIELGPLAASWFFPVKIADPEPLLSVWELYDLITTITKKCKNMYNMAIEETNEPLVKSLKRGSRRGLVYWDRSDGKLSEIFVTKPELPRILPAPKGGS